MKVHAIILTTENSELLKQGWQHNAWVWGGGSTDLTVVLLFSWFYALQTEDSNSMLTPRRELQTISWCCQVELLVSSEFSALFNRGAASADGQCLRPSIRVRTFTESKIQPESWHLPPPLSTWWELSPRHCISDRCPCMKCKRLSQPKAFPNLEPKTEICKQMYSLNITGHVPRWSHTVPGVPPQLPGPTLVACRLVVTVATIKNSKMLHLAHPASPCCQLYLCCSQFRMFQKSDYLCKTEQSFWHAEEKCELHLMMRFSYNYHTKAVLLVF